MTHPRQGDHSHLDHPVRCTGCHARGAVPAFISGLSRPWLVTCSRCGGTGLVPPDFEEGMAAGKRLRALRNELRLSLGEAARLIPCAVSTLSAAETGKMPPDHVAVFVRWLTERRAKG